VETGEKEKERQKQREEERKFYHNHNLIPNEKSLTNELDTNYFFIL
jgi:hypothetical protein